MRFIPPAVAAAGSGRHSMPGISPSPSPDLKRQMEVFTATMKQNQEMIQRGFQEVIDLCRLQTSEYAALRREVNLLQSQFRSHLSRY